MGAPRSKPIPANILPWSEYHGKLSYDAYADREASAPVKRWLRIALLTMEPGNFSNRRLIEEAEKRDHVIEPINTLRCYMNIKSIASAVHSGRGRPTSTS